jgi:hypothetical protein
MNTRKPIGLSVPHRSPDAIIKAQAERIAELEAQIRTLQQTIRNLDRAALLRNK